MIQIPIIKAVCQVVPDKKICYVYVPYINLWKSCESGAGHNWPKDHNF